MGLVFWYTDLQAVLAHLANGLSKNRTRHIAVDTGFICDALDDKDAVVLNYHSEDNLADALAGAEVGGCCPIHAQRSPHGQPPPQDAKSRSSPNMAHQPAAPLGWAPGLVSPFEWLSGVMDSGGNSWRLVGVCGVAGIMCCRSGS